MKTLLLTLIIFLTTVCTFPVWGQKTAATKLDKMPQALEVNYALSALPPQLRAGATIYLLDPAKGYYVYRKGSNGFICFVMRTAWEWGEFRNDIVTAQSYDAEGARTIFPIFMDVAAMRASGKYTAVQARNIVIDRIKKGVYKAPSHTGISYMLGPVMRTYPGTPSSHQVMTMHMPHYMIYAPYLENSDIGNIPDGQADGPVLVNPEEMFLGKRKAPYSYIIMLPGEQEKSKIEADNKKLLQDLAAYKPFFKSKS